MNVDDAIAELEAAQPPWDDLLERRVLVGVHAEHARRGVRRVRLRRAVAVAGALVLAIGLGGWIVGDFDSAEATVVAIDVPAERANAAASEASVPSAARSPAVPRPAGTVLALADGSHVDLDDGARLQTLVQTDAVVRFAHEEGRARYTTNDDPDRTFVVQAGAYEVRATTAVFVIEVAAERVHVRVESGTVEIEDGDRTIPLVDGEQLELTRRPGDAPSTAPAARSEATRTRATARDIDAMLDEADAARRAGRLDRAAALLRTIASTFEKDARVPSVWFMLGRVERRRGRDEAAARAFRRAGQVAKSDALAEDALAEEAASWHDAGDRAKATDAVERYLKRWPSGTHARRIRAIVP